MANKYKVGDLVESINSDGSSSTGTVIYVVDDEQVIVEFCTSVDFVRMLINVNKIKEDK